MEHRIRLDDTEIFEILSALIHYRAGKYKPEPEWLDYVDKILHRFKKLAAGTYGKRIST